MFNHFKKINNFKSYYTLYFIIKISFLILISMSGMWFLLLLIGPSLGNQIINNVLHNNLIVLGVGISLFIMWHFLLLYFLLLMFGHFVNNNSNKLSQYHNTRTYKLISFYSRKIFLTFVVASLNLFVLMHINLPSIFLNNYQTQWFKPFFYLYVTILSISLIIISILLLWNYHIQKIISTYYLYCCLEVVNNADMQSDDQQDNLSLKQTAQKSYLNSHIKYAVYRYHTNNIINVKRSILLKKISKSNSLTLPILSFQ